MKLKSISSWLAAGALLVTIMSPAPSSFAMSPIQKQDQNKDAGKDKSNKNDADKDKCGTCNSGGKNDGGHGSFDPPNTSGSGNTQHDNGSDKKADPKPKPK